MLPRKIWHFSQIEFSNGYVSKVENNAFDTFDPSINDSRSFDELRKQIYEKRWILFVQLWYLYILKPVEKRFVLKNLIRLFGLSSYTVLKFICTNMNYELESDQVPMPTSKDLDLAVFETQKRQKTKIMGD